MAPDDFITWINARLADGERLLGDDLATGPRYYFHDMQSSQYAHEFFTRVDRWRRWHSGLLTGLRRRLRRADHLVNDAHARFAETKLLKFRVREFNNHDEYVDVDLSNRAHFLDGAGWLEMRNVFRTGREQEPSWNVARDTLLRELRNFIAMVLEQVPELEYAPSESSTAMPSADEDRFGPLRAVAGGAYGDVWRAHDQKLQREVAIKFIRTTGAGAALVWQHGRAVARVPHPNIVTVYDVMTVRNPETDEHEPAIVMEWIEGENLATRLRRVVDKREASRIGTGVMDALGAIHAEALAHFDLHPENVLVGPNAVKVIDLFFGVSALSTTAIEAGQRGRDVRSATTILTSLLMSTPIDVDLVAAFQRQALAADVTLERLRAAFDEALTPPPTPSRPDRPPLDDLGRRLLLHVAAVGDGDHRGRTYVPIRDLAQALNVSRPEIDDQVSLAVGDGLLAMQRMGKYVELTLLGRQRAHELGADHPSPADDARHLLAWLLELGEGEQRGRVEVDHRTINAALGFGPLRFRDAARLLEQQGLATMLETAGPTGGRITVWLEGRGRHHVQSPVP